VGRFVGTEVGVLEGTGVGPRVVGRGVGCFVGDRVGRFVGAEVGVLVGTGVGVFASAEVGVTVGALGVSVGRVVGNWVATGLEVGGLVGAGTGGMGAFVPNRIGALGWFEGLAVGSANRVGS
jgi:hypothetical protein